MPLYPLILGHRGASGDFPENTLLAFEQARLAEADGVELDVFLTKDHQVVVTHDQNTKRISGQSLNVLFSTLSQLKQLDMGRGEKIPTLCEALDVCRSMTLVNIEIKPVGFFSAPIEKFVMKAIQSVGLKAEQILVSSFHPLHLWRMRCLWPELRLGYLLAPDQNWIYRQPLLVKKFCPAYLNLSREYFTNLDGNLFWQMPQPKAVWTVNTKSDMILAVQKKAQVVITNFPKMMHDWRNHGRTFKMV